MSESSGSSLNELQNEYNSEKKYERETHKPSFSKYYQSRSRSFNIRPSFKAEFIDQEFIDVIDSKTPKSRVTEFIKRKVPNSKVKAKTEPTYSEKQRSNEKAGNIFNQTFIRERKKFLKKIESVDELKEKVMTKLGYRKRTVPTFFSLEKKQIYTFQNQYKELFKSFNSKKLKHKKKVHPFCDIYEKEAKNVLKNHQNPAKKINYKPFGEIDYSVRY